jgi:hypothetical protein
MLKTQVICRIYRNNKICTRGGEKFKCLVENKWANRSFRCFTADQLITKAIQLQLHGDRNYRFELRIYRLKVRQVRVMDEDMLRKF